MTTRTPQGRYRDPMEWLAKPFNVIVSEKNLNQALKALERVGFNTGKELAKSQLRNYQEIIVEYLAISEQARSKARQGYEIKEEEEESFFMWFDPEDVVSVLSTLTPYAMMASVHSSLAGTRTR